MLPRFLGFGVSALALTACAAGHHVASNAPDPRPAATSAPKEESPAKPPAAVADAPAVSTPMAGEPSAATLADARLVAISCESREKEIATRIERMREEVDAKFKEWHDEQPACWAEDRKREAERREFEACIARGECGYGLGLSGVGEGGGGSGWGFGAGSIGTIGHATGRASYRMGASVAGRAVGVRKAESMSRTNTQVVSVDEADIVKTDGRWVYVVANGALRIVEALSPHVVSTTKVPGVSRDMFIEGDRAVVFTSSRSGADRCTYGYDCTVAGDGSSTTIHVFDVTDRAAPRSLRRIEMSGSLITSRRIGNTVHTVVADGDSADGHYQAWPDDLPMCGTPQAVVVAKLAKLKAENERVIRASTSLPKMSDRGVDRPLCAGLLESKGDSAHTFTSLVSFDMTKDDQPAVTATVRSRPGAVFASEDALYMSTTRRKGREGWRSYYASVDETSELHKFRIGATPSATRYVGTGVVPGHVLNQFSMDQWHGYLRVATTRGRVPSPDVESSISMMAEGEGGSLVRVGSVDHIARGEDIRAVRFDDDRGYIVTFKKTDPLFVLDLHDVAQPKILGELKIPGFSTYIHRLDPNHLLSIGFDANDHGDFAYFDGVILQLFDVTNPTDPRLLHKEKLGTRGSSSAAATDHLAFNYFAEKQLLAIPMTLCEGGGDGRNGDQLAFSGLLVYRVSPETGFQKLGGVDHGKRGVDCSTWWSNARSAVVRSVFLDDLVYSMATDRLKVQRMSAFGTDLADIKL
ncbi:hypothetical protein AKJ09_05174 [Labilithrix luteola]|uniref:Beta propeller domain protein n=1 Tax=Labilithrix luteola TaxID=1391654 RepID=A0A0K1PYA1_9BACT|nr:beta-propeller domain-containing protein [Labilithrix luteola]AKU98510.1 hypothetical protein AKJ09_05174 [Labilithrix luteola]